MVVSNPLLNKVVKNRNACLWNAIEESTLNQICNRIIRQHLLINVIRISIKIEIKCMLNIEMLATKCPNRQLWVSVAFKIPPRMAAMHVTLLINIHISPSNSSINPTPPTTTTTTKTMILLEINSLNIFL